MSERFNLLAWKAGVPHGTEGSNPSLSTIILHKNPLKSTFFRVFVFLIYKCIPVCIHNKLRGLSIKHANHVWGIDITYIKIADGMVYMAAVID